jgi:hypothetical protein
MTYFATPRVYDHQEMLLESEAPSPERDGALREVRAARDRSTAAHP